MKVIHKVKKKDEATHVSMTSFALALDSPSPEPSILRVNEGLQTCGHCHVCGGCSAQTYHHCRNRSQLKAHVSAVSFSIKDQWLELENKTNKKVLTKQQCFHYAVIIQRDAIKKKEEENLFRTFFYFEETDYNPHTRVSPIVTQGKLKGSASLSEPVEDLHGPQHSKVPPYILPDMLNVLTSNEY